MKKVFCWGTFDIIHKGHIEFLKFARDQGDHLTVIVISDKAVMENKSRNPINFQNVRAENLKKVESVDDTLTPSDFDESCKIISSVKPDVFVF